MSDCAFCPAWERQTDRLRAERDTLAARVEELEGVLRKIEGMPWPNSESPYALVARAALSPQPKGGQDDE